MTEVSTLRTTQKLGLSVAIVFRADLLAVSFVHTAALPWHQTCKPPTFEWPGAQEASPQCSISLQELDLTLFGGHGYDMIDKSWHKC
eukprot:m.21692 g.21692  ORF g.21692 m.21692 type:complete len:87 (+) comp8322_c0_seq2:291-551(+)